jgi:hypothetical protein
VVFGSGRPATAGVGRGSKSARLSPSGPCRAGDAPKGQVRKRRVHGRTTQNGGHADAAYLALKARDARFDGRLFVGVTSTGIYCRPVCRVRTPRRENCRFFATRAQAEAAPSGPA